MASAPSSWTKTRPPALGLQGDVLDCDAITSACCIHGWHVVGILIIQVEQCCSPSCSSRARGVFGEFLGALWDFSNFSASFSPCSAPSGSGCLAASPQACGAHEQALSVSPCFDGARLLAPQPPCPDFLQTQLLLPRSSAERAGALNRSPDRNAGRSARLLLRKIG